MSLKLKAFTKTAGMFAAVSLSSCVLVLILNSVPQAWIPYIFITFLVCFLFWVAYSFNLATLESQEKLKKIAEEYTEKA